MRPLRICVDARRQGAGLAGGVEQIVIGLAYGLSRLTDGDEEYVFLTAPPDTDWIAPYLGGNSTVLRSASPVGPSGWRGRLAAISPIRRVWEAATAIVGERAIAIPRSDGTLERAAVDVVHFPRQGAFLTDVPSVYQPHDLQHLHLPKYFTRRERIAREVLYRAFCDQANTVVMMTRWGRDDISAKYGLPRDKVCVIPGASVLAAYPAPSSEDLKRVTAKFSLPKAFAFYPAQTFPHKNHLTLLKALAIARDHHGRRIPLVASGYQNEFFAVIKKQSEELGLSDLVRFVGFVDTLELRSLYRLARCLVFPSAFEGWGLPVTEAFAEAVPVVCSDATSLPEVVGDAALIVPVDDTEQLANALVRVWTDDELRRTLVERGRGRAASVSWDKIARIFRAHYRRIGGRQLTDEDATLVQSSYD